MWIENCDVMAVSPLQCFFIHQWPSLSGFSWIHISSGWQWQWSWSTASPWACISLVRILDSAIGNVRYWRWGSKTILKQISWGSSFPRNNINTDLNPCLSESLSRHLFGVGNDDTKVIDDVIYLYFLGEMIIKMIAMGVMGRGCYLQVLYYLSLIYCDDNYNEQSSNKNPPMGNWMNWMSFHDIWYFHKYFNKLQETWNKLDCFIVISGWEKW